MPKILIVDFGLVWGGQEIYSRSIANNLLERNWTVSVVSPHDRHNIPGVNFHSCTVEYSNFINSGRLVNSLTKKNDVVHFNGIRAIYLSSVLPHKKAFIGTKHLPYSSLERQTIKTKAASLASILAFRNLDWLISISDQTIKELPRRVQNRSSVVLNGVNDMGPPELSGINNKPLTVCFVGRFVEHKGLLRLLSAISKVHQQGVSIKILIAGGGPLETDAHNYVQNHNISQIVKFLGYVESPGEIFRQSHICILPSIHEGLPLSLLEALSAGCALLGHDIPGVREVIRHEVNGLISDISPDSLASALKRLDSDRPLLEKLRKSAREDYDHNWRLDRMVDETEAIYKHAIDSKKLGSK